MPVQVDNSRLPRAPRNDTPQDLRGEVLRVVVLDTEASAQEYLAATVEVAEGDDSLAIEYSILRSSEHTLLEDPKPVYYKWWVKCAVGMLAVWLCLWAWVWRLTIGLLYLKKDKVYWGLGPIGGSWFFDRIHWLSRQIRRGVTTSEALDAAYAAPIVLANPNGWRDRVARFWFWQPDAASVRNRLRITYDRMFDELEAKHWNGQTTFRMLSLACGSAQASIEVLSAFSQQYPGVDITLTLVDMNKSSLRRAVKLAQAREVAHLVVIREENLRDFLANQIQDSWDLIEMVGFLDYRTEESIVRLTRGIRQILRKNGLYVAAHIAPAPIWQYVTAQVHRWHFMVRRTPDHYHRLLREGGFKEGEVELIVEPHQIHTISLCRKR